MTKIQIIVNDKESITIEKEFITEEDIRKAIESIVVPVLFKVSSKRKKKFHPCYNSDELLKRFEDL